MKAIKEIIFFIFISFTIHVNAQVFKSNAGSVSFFSEAPLENIDATSNNIVSVINTSTNEIVFLVPISTFQFKKKLMQEHFNENYVESDKYPKASFNGSWTGDIALGLARVSDSEPEMRATRLSVRFVDTVKDGR